MIKSVISILALISFTNAVLEPGVCGPKPPTITEFDAERVKFMHKYHEQTWDLWL